MTTNINIKEVAIHCIEAVIDFEVEHINGSQWLTIKSPMVNYETIEKKCKTKFY